MQKQKTRLIAIIHTAILLFLMLSTTSAAMTENEAVEWAKAQVGKTYGYGQCTDLVNEYAWECFGVYLRGSAGGYLSYVPDGWKAIKYYKGFIASPGDIAVWGPGKWISDSGHVAIIISATDSGFTSVDQNWNTRNGGAAAKIVTHSYSTYDSFLGVLRPSFNGKKGPQNPDDEILSDNSAPLTSFIETGSPKVGDPLGNVLYSDITAYINGNLIPTSIISGKTLVVVEDLANYGFDVKWDGKTKTLTVELNKNKKFTPLKVEKNTKPVGTFKCKYVYTDIKTYISGVEVESFAISGVTLIDFELLAKYGKISWDNATRELKLTVEGLEIEYNIIYWRQQINNPIYP
jgi:hypothetical protein